MNPISFLRNAMKNAPWLVMAIAIHVIIIVVLGIMYVAKEKPKQKEEAVQISISKPREDLPVEEIKPEEIDRKAIPKNDENEIVTFEEDVYIPTTETVPEDLHLDRGDPTSMDDVTTGGTTGGTAIGVGTGGHHGTRPSPFGGRKLGTTKKGRAGGPTEGTEKAVLEGLRWLIRHQNPDGSWSATNLKDRCNPDSPCYDSKDEFHPLYDEGLTSLAILCFLGAGYSHESKQTIVDTVQAKRHKVGEVIKNGLMWLTKRQDADGHFTRDKAFMYNEALATMALAEAYGLTQNRYWKDPAQKGVDFIQRAQRPNPSGNGLWGWRYQSRMEVEDFRKTGTDAAASKEVFDADTSVTTWCVMALKSAQLSGLTVKKESMDGALEFIKWVTADNGMVGYIDPKGAGATVTGKNDHFKYHPTVMSALGMCSRIFITHDPDDPFLDLAAKQVINDLPTVSKDKLSIDYYYWYYGSLALNQYDGPDSPKKSNKYWGPWNKAMVESVISLQNTEEQTCRRGGWTTMDRWAYTGGPIYTTAINVLTLEVYYRYENAFGGSKRN